jgi:branched-subunit amino acid transport protein
MNTLETWLTIFGLAVVTVITRNFFIVLGDRIKLPERVQHGLRYAPACALTALIAPELLTAGGQWAIDLGNERLLAGAAAIAVGLLTRNVVATMFVGIATFALLRAFAI